MVRRPADAFGLTIRRRRHTQLSLRRGGLIDTDSIDPFSVGAVDEEQIGLAVVRAQVVAVIRTEREKNAVPSPHELGQDDDLTPLPYVDRM